MKILSKSIIASILSTLAAASVMAQCSNGGCPWGSYNRNFDQGGLLRQNEWNNNNQYQSGYNSQGPRYYEGNRGYRGNWGNNYSQREFPYPYGAQTYYENFDEHGTQHAGMQQETQASNAWSTTSASPNANNAQTNSSWGWGTTSANENANNPKNAEQTPSNANTNNQNLNAPRK